MTRNPNFKGATPETLAAALMRPVNAPGRPDDPPAPDQYPSQSRGTPQTAATSQSHPPDQDGSFADTAASVEPASPHHGENQGPYPVSEYFDTLRRLPPESKRTMLGRLVFRDE